MGNEEFIAAALGARMDFTAARQNATSSTYGIAAERLVFGSSEPPPILPRQNETGVAKQRADVNMGQVLKLRRHVVQRSTAQREKPGFVAKLKKANRIGGNLSRY